MDTLMRMQSSCEIARTRHREAELTVKPYRPPVDAGLSPTGVGGPTSARS